jgi:CelD/BcsL family acetyltransferase involved in cellulose biosynthesis
MGIAIIDPLSDARWRTFVDRHPAGGIFHTPEWLEALRRTYDYQPVAYVENASDNTLAAGIPFCGIRSALTGRRLVSLPFSDHCQPLTSNTDQLTGLISAVREDVQRRKLKYFELRPLTSNETEPHQLRSSYAAVVHRLDLSGGLEQTAGHFHKDCILRSIRKAERTAELRYEEGLSDALLAGFYRLLVLTRRRQHIPPQPISWFRNLRDCLRDSMCIRVLSKDDRPVAATISLSFKNVVTYKYSCSDPGCKRFSGSVLLLWRIIRDAVAHGATAVDLGRSDLDNPGLILFKDRWGAQQSTLTYYRYPHLAGARLRGLSAGRVAQRVISTIPDSIFTAMGGVFYRHVG